MQELFDNEETCLMFFSSFVGLANLMIQMDLSIDLMPFNRMDISDAHQVV
jgi:hypothetical protein